MLQLAALVQCSHLKFQRYTVRFRKCEMMPKTRVQSIVHRSQFCSTAVNTEQYRWKPSTETIDRTLWPSMAENQRRIKKVIGLSRGSRLCQGQSVPRGVVGILPVCPDNNTSWSGHSTWSPFLSVQRRCCCRHQLYHIAHLCSTTVTPMSYEYECLFHIRRTTR